MSDYEKAFDLVISAEGGYVNDPHDSGGETNYGISKRQYPTEDIASLTLARVKIIYKRDYWDICKCDQIPYPMNICVFDGAVNQGVSAALKMLQRVARVAQDGIIGRDTLRALDNLKKHAEADYMAYRAMRYMSTRNADKYLKGWLRRIFRLMQEL